MDNNSETEIDLSMDIEDSESDNDNDNNELLNENADIVEDTKVAAYSIVSFLILIMLAITLYVLLQELLK